MISYIHVHVAKNFLLYNLASIQANIQLSYLVFKGKQEKVTQKLVSNSKVKETPQIHFAKRQTQTLI